MISTNWRNIEQVSRDRYRSRQNYPTSFYKPSRNLKLIFAVPLFLLLALAIFSQGDMQSTESTAHVNPISFAGSGSPTVYVTPASIPLGTIGSTFTVQVKVANMA